MQNYCRKRLYRNALNSNLYTEMHVCPTPSENFQKILAPFLYLGEADSMTKIRGCMFPYGLSKLIQS